MTHYRLKCNRASGSNQPVQHTDHEAKREQGENGLAVRS